MSWSRSTARLAVIIAGGAVLILAAMSLKLPEEELVQRDDIPPPGRWHLQASRLGEEPDGDELARVLSLPYLAGSTSAPARDGVIRYDPDRAFDGLNLYVSGHGPEVLLVDMTGHLIHRWRYPFETAFPDKEPTFDTAYIRRAHLYANGDLLAIFQGGGMVKLDRDSHLLWASDLPYYNHLFVTASGQILAIAKTARVIPELRPRQAVLEDSIVQLTPDGEVEHRLSLLECFSGSPFAAMIHPLPDYADIFHTNTIQPIGDALAEASDLFQPGLLVVSLREIDTVALIDPQAATVKAAWRGPWRAQHQPVPLPTGSILLFDNQGADAGSRVVEFDPANGELLWEFPRKDQEQISSPQAGSCQRLPNGNTLITESEMGRALEITPESQVVWEFVSPHRAGERSELVATLFEVIRLPADALPFVETHSTR